jgi:hypothetical protein
MDINEEGDLTARFVRCWEEHSVLEHWPAGVYLAVGWGMLGEFLGFDMVHGIEGEIDERLEGPASYCEDKTGEQWQGWSDDWLGHVNPMIEVI